VGGSETDCGILSFDSASTMWMSEMGKKIDLWIKFLAACVREKSE
jgi:hypothetical protein